VTTVNAPALAKKTPTAFVPPANAAPGGGNGLLWVNTSSKAYHKEGSKWKVVLAIDRFVPVYLK
jgi:hypothetical protein